MAPKKPSETSIQDILNQPATAGTLDYGELEANDLQHEPTQMPMMQMPMPTVKVSYTQQLITPSVSEPNKPYYQALPAQPVQSPIFPPASPQAPGWDPSQLDFTNLPAAPANPPSDQTQKIDTSQYWMESHSYPDTIRTDSPGMPVFFESTALPQIDFSNEISPVDSTTEDLQPPYQAPSQAAIQILQSSLELDAIGNHQRTTHRVDQTQEINIEFPDPKKVYLKANELRESFIKMSRQGRKVSGYIQAFTEFMKAFQKNSDINLLIEDTSHLFVIFLVKGWKKEDYPTPEQYINYLLSQKTIDITLSGTKQDSKTFARIDREALFIEEVQKSERRAVASIAAIAAGAALAIIGGASLIPKPVISPDFDSKPTTLKTVRKLEAVLVSLISNKKIRETLPPKIYTIPPIEKALVMLKIIQDPKKHKELLQSFINYLNDKEISEIAYDVRSNGEVSERNLKDSSIDISSPNQVLVLKPAHPLFQNLATNNIGGKVDTYKDLQRVIIVPALYNSYNTQSGGLYIPETKTMLLRAQPEIFMKLSLSHENQHAEDFAQGLDKKTSNLVLERRAFATELKLANQIKAQLDASDQVSPDLNAKISVVSNRVSNADTLLKIDKSLGITEGGFQNEYPPESLTAPELFFKNIYTTADLARYSEYVRQKALPYTKISPELAQSDPGAKALLIAAQVTIALCNEAAKSRNSSNVPSSQYLTRKISKLTSILNPQSALDISDSIAANLRNINLHFSGANLANDQDPKKQRLRILLKSQLRKNVLRVAPFHVRGSRH